MLHDSTLVTIAADTVGRKQKHPTTVQQDQHSLLNFLDRWQYILLQERHQLCLRPVLRLTGNTTAQRGHLPYVNQRRQTTRIGSSRTCLKASFKHHKCHPSHHPRSQLRRHRCQDSMLLVGAAYLIQPRHRTRIFIQQAIPIHRMETHYNSTILRQPWHMLQVLGPCQTHPFRQKKVPANIRFSQPRNNSNIILLWTDHKQIILNTAIPGTISLEVSI